MEILVRIILLAIHFANYLVFCVDHPTAVSHTRRIVNVTFMEKHLTVKERLAYNENNVLQYIATSVIHPAGMHGVPQRWYAGWNDYVTKAIYPDGVKLIVFIKINATTGEEEFLGATPEPRASELRVHILGDPRLLTPNKYNWFMAYKTGLYQVVENSEGHVIDVFRLYTNKRPPFEHPYSTIHVHYANVHFKLYKDEVKNEILGADVDHDGQSHVGSSSSAS